MISRIRLAQADVVTSGRANVGIAISHDYGDDEDHGVHSRYKSEPARRLALELVRHAYRGTTLNGTLAAQAPTPMGKAMVIERNATSVKVAVPLSDAETGLALMPTTKCEVQYSGQCCGNASFPAPLGPVLGRLCTTANASECNAADGSKVVLANVTVDVDRHLIFSGLLGDAAATVHWVDFSLTDFPQCAVRNGAGLAVGPFGPLKVMQMA